MPYFDWKDKKIFYRTQGEGPLLVILPGNTASSICHQGELEHFSENFQAVSMDYLGTGKSERLEQWTADWWKYAAEQVSVLVDHLNHANCILMGTSGGAIVAFLAALNFPEKVRAIIADSLEYCIPKSLVLESIMKERAMRTDPQKQFWEFAHGADWEDVVEADTSMLLKFAERGGDWAEGRLGEIGCPVLLTGSKLDSSIPHLLRDYSRIAEAIVDCSVYINDSGDHPFMWTAPQDFRPICDHFLKRLVDPK